VARQEKRVPQVQPVLQVDQDQPEIQVLVAQVVRQELQVQQVELDQRAIQDPREIQVILELQVLLELQDQQELQAQQEKLV
jgi:hypothetical protein